MLIRYHTSSELLSSYVSVAALGESVAAFDHLEQFTHGFSIKALFVYDYVMTIGSEVTIFWLPLRVNGGSILFLLNRYFTLVAQLLAWVHISSYHVRVFPINIHIHTEDSEEV